MGRTKVYKWTWDRKKKEQADAASPGNMIVGEPDKDNVSRHGSHEESERTSTATPITTSLANRFRIEMARQTSQNISNVESEVT